MKKEREWRGQQRNDGCKQKKREKTGKQRTEGRTKGSLVILCRCDSCSTQWWPQGSPHHGIARLQLKAGPVAVSQSRQSASLESVKTVRGWQHLSQTLSHNSAVIESSPESLSLENEK